MFRYSHHDEIKVVAFLTIFYHFCAIVNRAQKGTIALGGSGREREKKH
jgi:hypothetical protein